MNTITITSFSDYISYIEHNYGRNHLFRGLKSEYWKEFSDTHHENCAGCKEIAKIVSGAKSGRNQAQWKMITMLHYIYTMFETSA